MQNKKKERVFGIIDDLIDNNVIGDVPLDKYIREYLPSLRRRCSRVFGGLKHALNAYGYDCIPMQLNLTFDRLFDYIDCCFKINTDGHIRIDFEMLFRKVAELQAMGYCVELDDIIKGVSDIYVLDRIEAFTLYHNENIADVLDYRPRQYPTNQIEHLIRNTYKDRKRLYKTYHISLSMLSGTNTVKIRGLMQLGSEFESLVQEIFTQATISHERHVFHNGCIPDFISGNTWLDAKLSKSTALNAGCATITKYRQHTEHLVIIYALDDTPATDDRATFVHVSEYYPYITPELKRKVDAFIRKAEAVRFGGAA